MLKNICETVKSKMKLHGTTGQIAFNRDTIRRPISSKLFTLALEGIFKITNWFGKGININGDRLTHLVFDDDVILSADKGQDLE